MRKWYPAILIAVTLVMSVLAYPRLPDEVPRHWNFDGEPTAYWSKGMAVIVIPMLLTAVWLSLRVAPSIDPRRENYVRMRPTYDLVINTLLTVLAALHAASLAYALGVPIDMRRVGPGAIGAAFLVIGNVLPRARPNWWFGIRTPWTLSNDRVWERTHRFGGYVVTAEGLLGVAIALGGFHISIGVMLALLVACGVAVTAFSYVAWRQETSR